MMALVRDVDQSIKTLKKLGLGRKRPYDKRDKTAIYEDCIKRLQRADEQFSQLREELTDIVIKCNENNAPYCRDKEIIDTIHKGVSDIILGCGSEKGCGDYLRSYEYPKLPKKSPGASAPQEEGEDGDKSEPRKTTLIFGMVRTLSADTYAKGEQSVHSFKVEERRGRDIIRIGELIRMKHRVYSVSTSSNDEDKADEHINADFTLTSGRRGLINYLSPFFGVKFDYIIDDWFYIPKGAYGDVYFKPSRWENVYAMAEKGFLNEGCQVITPWRSETVSGLFGGSQTNQKLYNHFVVSFLDQATRSENPLWEAVIRSRSEWLIRRTKDELENHLSVYKGCATMFGLIDIPSFIVLTYSEEDVFKKRKNGISFAYAHPELKVAYKTQE